MKTIKTTRLPPLKSLPPNSEAFAENVKRVICKHASGNTPWLLIHQNLDATLHGWQMDASTKSLIPVQFSPGTKPAPAESLKMIHCGCSSDEPCKTAMCGCMIAQLSCTVFCAYTCAANCNNQWTDHATLTLDDEDSDEGGLS